MGLWKPSERNDLILWSDPSVEGGLGYEENTLGEQHPVTRIDLSPHGRHLTLSGTTIPIQIANSRQFTAGGRWIGPALSEAGGDLTVGVVAYGNAVPDQLVYHILAAIGNTANQFWAGRYPAEDRRLFTVAVPGSSGNVGIGEFPNTFQPPEVYVLRVKLGEPNRAWRGNRGELVYSGNAEPWDPSGGTFIGGNSRLNTFVNWAGGIGEFTVFNSCLSDPDADVLHSYLAHRWDCKNSLRPGTNYLLSPPGTPNLQGVAITSQGNAVDRVVVFDEVTDRKVVAAFPNATGEWGVAVETGSYYVRYEAQGCAPTLHGPYYIEAT